MDEYRDKADAGDDPALAFERLRGEVALLRHAVEGMTAAREAIDIPDYEPTLERTEKVLGLLVRQIDAVRKSPAMTLTPENMGGRLNASVADAARELQHQVHSAKSTMAAATHDLQDMVASARRKDEQNQWLSIAAASSLVAGLALCALMAGPIARLAPAHWLWPERMAARIVNEPTPWDAGAYLMARASPPSWEAIVAAANLVKHNRETIETCREAAAKAKKTARCTIDFKYLP
ncbi:DUF6118 family protein [Sphingobium sp. TB-6]|uniref:DUF6118 family protein n=1 Tax=Sphingobium sp. TB-6 TaxID=2728850 RepID=UPI0019D142DE|nr:DUF6118 family protein [Sphingobium sp. TB-6]